jgi:hypothetical protein
MAERVGFEPTVPKGYNGFRVRRQPCWVVRSCAEWLGFLPIFLCLVPSDVGRLQAVLRRAFAKCLQSFLRFRPTFDGRNSHDAHVEIVMTPKEGASVILI